MDNRGENLVAFIFQTLTSIRTHFHTSWRGSCSFLLEDNMSIITPLFIGSVSDIEHSYGNNLKSFHLTFCCQGNNAAEDIQTYIKVLAPTFSAHSEYVPNNF